MDYVVAIAKLPLRILWAIISHPKLLILGVVVIMAFFGIRACQSGTETQASNKQTKQPAIYQETAPDIKSAPYVVTTSSRIYYVQQYSGSEQLLTLNRYYTYLGKEWIYKTEPLVLNHIYYGSIKIHERH